MARWIKRISLLAAMLIALACTHSWSQQNPKRLIMKDGTYQSATKWEVVGQRVRYYSAERYDWEELPNELVDWPATDKYNNERAGQRDETIKEIAKADEADEREAPLIVPGLRLPNTGGVFLLDTLNNQLQLVELIQNGGELNKHTGRNILRAAINPLALSSTQTIELKGEHARVQSHVGQPAIYLNIDTADNSQPAFTQKKPDKDQQPNRYGIVRVENKKDLRIVGKLNIAMYGKVSQKESWIPGDYFSAGRLGETHAVRTSAARRICGGGVAGEEADQSFCVGLWRESSGAAESQRLGASPAGQEQHGNQPESSAGETAEK